MLITNATLADGRRRDVRVNRTGRINAVEPRIDPAGDETVRDVAGKLLLPGMIDIHVHFRQPGAGHKETWKTGSQSALAGGVTTVVDQPNTDPPTISGPAFEQKAACATDSYVDFGLNGGVTDDWDPDSLFEKPLFALGEVFLADSTGNMGIDTDLFEVALERASANDVPVTVHAEDGSLFDESATDRTDADAWSAYRTPRAEVAAIERACTLATAHDTPIHVAHTSTPDGIDTATAAGMTCEVTPHHMLLSREDYPRLGTHGRMNPPLRSKEKQQAVFDRVCDGTVDIIATDHAPHTRAEKDASIWEAPSGVPGVETALGLLLAVARDGPLSIETVRDLTARTPAELFDLEKGHIEPGYEADLVCFDLDAVEPIRAESLHTNCEWTPFEGMDAIFPEWTMVGGSIAFHDGEFEAPVGTNVHS
ncbi:dihydroorotase [Halocatena halophila]|uniref:dihydroorotase n=1 Tax=Halocatena halophila TaxID=2814576 RepID=UPI002ED087A9